VEEVTLTKGELGILLTTYRAAMVMMVPKEDKEDFYYDEECAMRKHTPGMYDFLQRMKQKLRTN